MNHVKEIVHAKNVYNHGYTGTGIRIALLDTGISAMHPDFRNCNIIFRDFVNGKVSAYDDNGHGTHIGGILCGNGYMSKGKISGMAPNADLLVIKVLDHQGNGNTDEVLKALDWIKKNHNRFQIKLMNFSVGFLPRAKKKEQDELLQAIDDLWDEGIMIITAAGNNGPDKRSITVPGISRKVVTVGASDDTSGNSTGLPFGYSGKGPTACCIVKPEILAPGTQIASVCHENIGYIKKSGTSMAAPVVCGALALAYEKAPDITPAGLKLRLYQTVQPLKHKEYSKSWGILHVDNLMKML